MLTCFSSASSSILVICYLRLCSLHAYRLLFSAMFLTCLCYFQLCSSHACHLLFFHLYSLQASLAIASMLVHADPLSFQHHQICLLKSALHPLSFQHGFQLCFVHACQLLVMYIRAENLCSVEACCLLFFIHVPYMHACHLLFHINVPYKQVPLLFHLMLLHAL